MTRLKCCNLIGREHRNSEKHRFPPECQNRDFRQAVAPLTSCSSCTSEHRFELNSAQAYLRTVLYALQTQITMQSTHETRIYSWVWMNFPTPNGKIRLGKWNMPQLNHLYYLLQVYLTHVSYIFIRNTLPTISKLGKGQGNCMNHLYVAGTFDHLRNHNCVAHAHK